VRGLLCRRHLGPWTECARADRCRSCGCTFPQTDEIDDLFNFSTDVEESGNDLEFDTSELEQIEMLETFRTNLAASSSGAGGAGRINAGRGGALPLPSQEK